MKNILKSTLLLMCSVGLFAACADNNDSNPTIKQPSTFVLNEPGYASKLINLANSTDLAFSWTQPDYGFPAEASYDLEVSLSGNFTVSTEQANADESGTTIPDYAVISSGLLGGKGSMDATVLDRNLVQIAGWQENNVPVSQTVYVRAKAFVSGTSPIYSNVVNINVTPYYIMLKDAAPELWYLVGECIGDGSWGNSADNIGKAIFPLMTIGGETYDKVTGKGVISYTGYFPAGKGFKLVKIPGKWDDQWGAGDSGYVMNDGGSGNITVASDGYYTVTLDTKNYVLSIDPYEGSVRVFSSMGIPGGHNDWDPAGNAMTGFDTYDGSENHVWSAAFDHAEDVELKFAADGGWDFNWGAADFPYGQGTQNGPNIPYKAGSYKVFLNDITGQFMFIEN